MTKSEAERKARLRAELAKSGVRQVSVMIYDTDALQALDALSAKLGSQRAAIEYALKKCRPRKS